MNFQLREEATEQGDSFEIYKFTSEEFTYTFTSHNEDVIVDAKTYTAVPIKRGSFSKDLTEGVIRCSVQAPITTFFMEYILAYPVLPVSVEIRKYYFADMSQSALVFYGRINSFTVNGQVGTVECVSSISELNNKVPRVFVQSLCNNVFKGETCGINPASFTSNETVLGISNDGRILTLTGIGALYGWYGGYKQGIVSFQHDSRYIAEQVTNQIQIHFPLRDLTVGDVVQVTVGCDKTGLTCRYKFNNLLNYVGMPYLPLGPNPVNWGVD